MPKHFEFVLAAYGLWVVAFAVYLLYLNRKARITRRTLARMSGGRHSSDP